MDDKLVVLFGAALGAIAFFFMFLKRNSIRVKPYASKNPEKDLKIRTTDDGAAWAESNGFEFLGFFTVQYGIVKSFMAAWKSKDKPSYFCQHIVGKYADSVEMWDFSTSFENDIELETCDKDYSHLRPKPPGQYYQSFSQGDFDDLYKRHLEGEEFLIKEGWAKPKKPPVDFEEELVNSLGRISKWNWRHWYWIFIILYFYFVRLRRWHNKSIKQQHELGMIRLPNEISIEQLDR